MERALLLVLTLIVYPIAPPSTSKTSVAPHAQFDHLVVGIRSLDAGIREFAQLTGVTAEIGGKHPGRGTENALASLGGGSYLEIIAPEPDVKLSPRDEAMRGLSHLKVIAWAIRVSDVNEAAASLKAAGLPTTNPEPGARVTPAGTRLEWRTFRLADQTIASAPFFIEWSSSTKHPSTSAPGGCSLGVLKVHDPASERLAAALSALGVADVAVVKGEPGIEATIECGSKTATLK
jgi:Glyoxalase-like domain